LRLWFGIFAEKTEKSIAALGKKVPLACSFLEYLFSHPKIDAQLGFNDSRGGAKTVSDITGRQSQ
jgi:hypothetical protein